MHTSASMLQTARNVLANEIQALQRVCDRLGDSFVDAVTLLDRCERVFIFGIGKSSLVGAKISATLSSIGKPSQSIHPVEALHGDIGNVTPGSCAVFISKSGTTPELLELIPLLKQRNVPIIGLLGSTTSFMAQNVDACIDCSVESEACTLNVAPTSSTTAALAIGDALAVALMVMRDVTPEDFAYHHPAGQLGKNLLLNVRDVMHAHQRLPSIHAAAGMREALIELTAKRMGCVCVLDDEKHLSGIITDGDVRRLLQEADNLLEKSVGEVMTERPVFITADASLHEALLMMERRETQINVLPVVDELGACVGVIRIHDILSNV